MPDPLVIQTLDQWRDKIAAREAAVSRQLAQEWLRVEGRLMAQMQDLAIYLSEHPEEALTAQRIMQLDRYQTLIAQARAESAKYARWAGETIAEAQGEALTMGLAQGQALIRAAMWDSGMIGMGFDSINVEAVNYMLGFAADGSPLSQLLIEAFPKSAVQLTQYLVDGIATGIGPRATAKLMADAMAGNLDRALLIARTEQLRALRTASLEQMSQSKVVVGYIRRAQRSGNVCMACLALDGMKVDSPDEVFAAHPACACYAQPVLRYGPTPQFQSGREWFESLSPEQQRAMAGKGRYELFEQGQLDWDKVATITDDPVWGPGVQVTPLAGLGVAG